MGRAVEISRGGRGLRRAPSELTTFVGRRRELADATARLSTARLVTIVGPGGVGKTRLALRVADSASRRFPAGAWFVDLAVLRESSLVGERVAAALGLRSDAGASPVEALVEHLRGKRLLLVLDNCEHLIEACAVVVDTLLRASAELRVLATSREPLRVEGESVLPLSPLSVPPEGTPASIPVLMRCEAVALLLQRATAATPEFAISTQNAGTVATLCRRLDGIPLAIELAAVNLRVRSPSEILGQLAERSSTLAGARRAGAERHQTLHATVAWSYSLLSEDERRVWRTLGVFAGGFTLEAAEHVCRDDRAIDLPSVLASLVDKSMVVRDPGPPARYRLLETLRDHAVVVLRSSGELDVARQRHRDLYADQARHAESLWWDVPESYWLSAASPEHDNVRAALEFCLSDPAEARIGLALCAALHFYWEVHGRVGEGRRWLGALLAADRSLSGARAKALAVDGYFAGLHGDHEASIVLLEAAAGMAREHGDARTLALTWMWLGDAKLNVGDARAARSLIEAAIASFERLGDPIGRALGSMGLAMALLALGEPSDGIALLENAIGTTRDRQHPRLLGHALRQLGLIRALSGNRAAGAALLKESLTFLRRPRYERALALSMETLAWIAVWSGDAERAGVLLRCASVLGTSVGTPLPSIWESYHDACEAAVRDRLGPRAEAAFAKSALWSTDEMIAFALEEDLPMAPGARSKASPTPDARLSLRERQTAKLVAHGLSNKEIAADLVLSERTVETHIRHVMDKLGVSSRVEIAVWAADGEP